MFASGGCAPSASLAQPNDDSAKESRRIKQPAITISKETTHLLAPRAANGYIDYVAAANELAREGVTVENNAVVELAEAFGAQMAASENAEAFFHLLGIPVPAPADPFVGWASYLYLHTKDIEDADELAATESKLRDQFSSAEIRPWSEEKFPFVADWLQVNRVPLEHIKRASRRPKFFAPFITREGWLSGESPGTGEVRHAAMALRTRAMLLVGKGEIEAAWHDLMAAHRLCKLCAQGPTVGHAFAAAVFMSGVYESDAALAAHARLPSDRLREMQVELARFPGPLLTERHVQGDRLSCLSQVVHVAVNGPRAFAADAHGETISADDWSAIRAEVDWNEIMRENNRWFDRAAAIIRQTDPARRPAELDQWCDEEKNRYQDWDIQQFSLSGRQRVLEATPAARKRMFRSLFRQMDSTMWVSQSGSAKHLRMRWPLTEAAFALGAYHADRGHYPNQLAELVPDYLASIPRDVYSDGELKYQATSNGFLLYSVGMNGNDDGGRTYGSGDGADDLVVSAP